MRADNEGKGPETPDDPERSTDAVHVPDDISALAADIVALRREQAAVRRRQRWERATRWVRRLRWYGVSVPVVVAALLVVGGLGTMLVLLGPHNGLAEVGGRAVSGSGRAGDPLLDLTLRNAAGRTVPTSALHGPAEVLLVPARCGCDATVSAVTAAAAAAGVPAYVVVPTAATGTAELSDAGGVLLRTYGQAAAGPTLLSLDAQGLVAEVAVGVTAADAAGKVAAR